MITIKCSVYEKSSLLQYLAYAKEKKDEEFKKGFITREMYVLDTQALNRLINRVNGIYLSDYELNSKKYRRAMSERRYTEYEKEQMEKRIKDEELERKNNEALKNNFWRES